MSLNGDGHGQAIHGGFPTNSQGSRAVSAPTSNNSPWLIFFATPVAV
ncbi:hypothetical protein RSAG8_13946, partial [Rhizoctonia solani AG-8 WAC10335]